MPIPGTKRVARLEENTAATELQLSEEELGALEPIARACLSIARACA